MSYHKPIGCLLATLFSTSFVQPTIAQPVPVMALPLVSNPAGLIVVGVVTLAGVTWYVYENSHHKRFRSAIAPSATVHTNTNEPSPWGKGTRILLNKSVSSREQCKAQLEDFMRKYPQEAGKWELQEVLPLAPDNPLEPIDSNQQPGRIGAPGFTQKFRCRIIKVRD